MTSDKWHKLFSKVEGAHDWTVGQVYGHGGTAYSSVDRCRICGLERRYFSDSQNGVDSDYTFAAGDGAELTLRQASELEC